MNAGPLPPGWQEALDASTGVVYYYNRTLNTQQWTRPQAQAGAQPRPAAPIPPEDAVFVEAQSFAGARPGYVFKKDSRGLGYYRCATFLHQWQNLPYSTSHWWSELAEQMTQTFEQPISDCSV